MTFASRGFGDSILLGLYMVDTTGENRVLLSPGGSYSTWLPGDTAVVFIKSVRLYYLNLNTMQESLLCDCRYSSFPEMSSDSKSVYYEAPGVANNWATSIYRMDLLTGDTTHIVGGTFPSVSPDGRYLLISRHKIYRYDIAIDSEVVIFNSALAAHYDWSSDGENILIGNVIRQPDLSNKIYRINPDGTDPRYFTDGKYPKYSPNGDRIAIIRPSADGKDHVWLINTDGSDAKQITF